MGVCAETRRILKPSGSAVFILQPNSRRVGSMRGWLWEFMAWVCREWNMVQDVWWWNTTAMTNGVCSPRARGLMRASVKPCVWAGPSDCYRSQDSVLWSESERNIAERAGRRFARMESPSGNGVNKHRAASTPMERGGSIPYNLLPCPNNNAAHDEAGSHGHGAGTPLELAKWWTRYICPPGGTVIDMFMGSGTMMLAAMAYGCNGIGIERDEGYFAIAQRRVSEAAMQMPLIQLS